MFPFMISNVHLDYSTVVKIGKILLKEGNNRILIVKNS